MVVWHWSTLLLSTTLILLSVITVAHNTVPDGSSDGNSLVPCHLNMRLQEEMEECLQKVDRFLTMYARNLKRGRNARCADFGDVRDCLTSILGRCPAYQSAVPDDIQTIYNTVKCACNNSYDRMTECKRELGCFEDQYGGILGRRCDAFFRFNVRQGTREKCFFAEESVRCKEALVTSACGQDAGLMAFHMGRLTTKKADKCEMNINEEYPGFHYTESCPVDFVQDIDDCQAAHLRKSKLIFHDDNELVAVGNKRDVRRACRDFKEYKRCLQPLEESCSVGVHMFFEYSGRLRTYILKMNFICDKANSDYTTHMGCYQDVIQNQTLSRCSHIFESLLPLIRSVTAYDFYCHPDDSKSQEVQNYLDSLKECYENVFQRDCGHTASASIIELMQLAFKDPLYLLYKYKPDCSLHGDDTTITSSLARPTTTPRKNYGSSNLGQVSSIATKHKRNYLSECLELLLLFILVLR